MLDSGRQHKIIFLLFVISGLCGLLYQVVWIRLAYASFGVITPVLSVVISTFMLGLAIGSWGSGKIIDNAIGRKISAIHIYAAVEFLIATGAIAIPKLFSIGRRYLLTTGHMDSIGYLSLSALIIVTAILPFCILMGATFPLMMAHVKTIVSTHQKSFSYLYTANVIGAMTGVLISGFFLIEMVGFQYTIYIGAGLNYLIALICVIFLFKHDKLQKNKEKHESIQMVKWQDEKKQLLDNRIFMSTVLFLTGFISLSLEVIWIRTFTPILETQTYSFAGLLAVYLLATWIGTCTYRKQLQKSKTLSNATLLAVLAFSSFLPVVMNDPRLRNGIVTALFSIFPICLVLGYLTPKLIDDYSMGNPEDAGKAYAMNIIGCILGPLFASYIFLPYWGCKNSMTNLGGLLLLSCVVYYRKQIIAQKPALIFMILAFSLLFCSAFVNETYEEVFARIPGSEIRRDHTATVVSSGQGIHKKLYVNGISITNITSITKFMAHLPLIFCKQKPESALVICFGMGITYRSLLSWGIESTAVELVPSVKDAFGYYFSDAETILKNPKGKIFIDDGRRFLDRTSVRYDVITLDPPPPPEAAGSSMLYSTEFYKSVKSRLKDQGILQQWFPKGETKILQAIVRSLYVSFKYVRIFRSIEGWGYHFLASDTPIQTPHDTRTFSMMPQMAKADLVEWYSKKNDASYYIRLILKNELPIERLLNKNLNVVITDDKPYNEYYLVRRFIEWLGNNTQDDHI